MALCRCLEAHAWPRGRVIKYVAYLRPFDYPKTSLTCGLCDNPGVIWIDREEENAYHHGQRIFEGPNSFVRMKADDSGAYINNQDMTRGADYYGRKK